MTALNIATDYFKRGWQPLPIPTRAKMPVMKDWQNFVTNESELSNHFNGKPQNIGVLLGKPSNGLVDIDLDTPEARRAAVYFLPKTVTFGRIGNPISHYLFKCEIATKKYQDLLKVPSSDKNTRDAAMLVEIRSTGGQTVFPGSVHPSGELVEWTDGAINTPLEISAAELQKAVGKIAAAALLASYWRDGRRNELAMALSGALIRNGFDEAATVHFITAVCAAAQDDETSARIQTARSTVAKFRAGGNVTGLPKLVELTDKKIVDSICKWLQIESTPHEKDAEPKPLETPELSKLPVLSSAVFYGLAGDIVRTIEPHTEADNAALLIQLLAAFGNVIGKTAYFVVEADFHYLKINAVLIGMSSKGRKGTSWGQIKRLMEHADESFKDCVQDGLSSGEGLIYHVRDAQEKETPIKEKGRITGYQTEIFDPGATEKRAFILEPEFARVLRVMQREGNTLSSVIRQAWDSDRLRVMTKTPLKATNAHISIIGHITQDELRRNLDETETANGFANRFLWLFTRRSKFLPEGGNLKESDLISFISSLAAAINFAKQQDELRFDEPARNLWFEIYEKLSTGASGLLGSVTSRAEAQVKRLACIYALLDKSNVISREHLEAALALWQYCEDSARYVFGETTGDKSADEIMSALEAHPDGLDRTQISKLFSGNRTASQIKTALQSLLESGRVEQIEEKTAGRPREVFRASRYEINEINEIRSKSFSDSEYEINEINEISTQTECYKNVNSFNSFISSPKLENISSETDFSEPTTPDSFDCPNCDSQIPINDDFCPKCEKKAFDF